MIILFHDLAKLTSSIFQIKFIIQAPLKGYFSWMGVWVLSIVWFWIRGDLFPRDPRVLMMYNLQFSTTWAAQHSIKNLGYAVIFIIFSYIFAAELQEIDVVKQFSTWYSNSLMIFCHFRICPELKDKLKVNLHPLRKRHFSTVLSYQPVNNYLKAKEL